MYPIPELLPNASDVFLVFISANDVRYLEPVDDVMYSAHQANRPIDNQTTNLSAIPAYKADQPTAVLGCTIQYQFCNPSGNNCTSLTNLENAYEETYGLWNGLRQQQIFEFWFKMYEGLSHEIWNMLRSLTSSALVARNSLDHGIQGPLPADQWQREVLHWHATSLASLQRGPVEIAHGPFDTSMDRFVQKASNDGERYFCRNQVSNLSSLLTFLLQRVIDRLSKFSWIYREECRESHRHS